ncbi:MAG: hypothetical protein ACOY99_08145 [Pseudomonadota bacterium]
MARALTTIFLLAAMATLGGCSWFKSKDKSPIDLGAVGPQTKEQIAPLPKGLIADKANSLYSSQQLRGDENPN